MAFGIAPVEVVEELDRTGSWPYAKPPRHWLGDGGDWSLWMSRDASVVLWPVSDRTTPEGRGYLPMCCCTKDQGDSFLVTFCARGYNKKSWMKHQDGQVWLFNWRSYNLAQVAVTSQVAERLFAGDQEGAWEVGRAYADQIDQVVRDHYKKNIAT